MDGNTAAIGSSLPNGTPRGRCRGCGRSEAVEAGPRRGLSDAYAAGEDDDDACR